MDEKKLARDLFVAYYDARKNKRSTVNALAFEMSYESNLFRLRDDIRDGRYEVGPSIAFIVERPVKREIFAASFRDRIVHHLIYNAINPVFEGHFIRDSYSCRLGKGTSYGIRQAEHFVRSCSENHSKSCWILKLDIRGYFMSMNRQILFRKAEARIRSVKKPGFDPDLVLYLMRKVVFNDPTKNCRIKGRREDWIGLPKSKSLFFTSPGCGFPIGNLTSQLFANIYLDDFDHFVREELGFHRYGRYVDDMVFVHESRQVLKEVIPKIRAYLKSNLWLEIHPGKIYLQRCSVGMPFLGVFIKSWRIYVGRRMKGSFFRKIAYWNDVAGRHGDEPGSEPSAVADRIGKCVASMNSYLGIMMGYRTFALRKKMMTEVVSESVRSRIRIFESFEKVNPVEVPAFCSFKPSSLKNVVSMIF